MVIRQVQLDSTCATGTSLIAFVFTGSTDLPLVTLAGNHGFPEVQAVYAWPIVHSDRAGVQIVIRLTGPAEGIGITINLAQESMPGSFEIIPLI